MSACVQIYVDSNGAITLVPSERMVHSGEIEFLLETDGWEFDHDGITFTQREDGTPVPDDLFKRTGKEDQRIVFQDGYDLSDPDTPPEYAGRFDYAVAVKSVRFARHSDIERFSRMPGITADILNPAPVVLSSSITSGVVVNQ
jgi:hypothetical protein